MFKFARIQDRLGSLMYQASKEYTDSHNAYKNAMDVLYNSVESDNRGELATNLIKAKNRWDDASQRLYELTIAQKIVDEIKENEI